MLLDDNCIRADKILGLPPSGFPFLFTEPKRPAAQTFVQTVQVAIFFPPGNYGRVSGITGLLADENSAGVLYREQFPTYLMKNSYTTRRALPSLFLVPL